MSAASRSPQQDWSSQRLRALAEHLRQYRAPPPELNDDTSISSSIGMSASEASMKNLNVFPTKKRAAVLVCLYQGKDGEVRVILTKRAGTLASHSGDVALPGGKRDDGDADDIATALREAREEIGLLPSQIRVVTVLEPFLSRTLLTVVPVIGLLEDVKPFIPVPNPEEVDAVFDVPLEMFLKNENYWYQEREWLGQKYRVHYFDYALKDGEKFVVYGLTASILIRTAAIIFQREPNFLETAPFLRVWSHVPGAMSAIQ
jgi:coenzyme A diphosphatase NUDT7